MNDTVLPEIVQEETSRELIENVTGNPDEAVAATVYGTPTMPSSGAVEVKMIDCVDCGTWLSRNMPKATGPKQLAHTGDTSASVDTTTRLAVSMTEMLFESV